MRAGISGVQIVASVRYFPLLRNVQTSSVAHPASYSIGTGLLSRGESGRGVKLTTHLASICLPGLDRENFTFTDMNYTIF